MKKAFVNVLFALMLAGCATADPTPAPAPQPIPEPTPQPTPQPATAMWKGVMFVPATSGMLNNHGVSSQLDYRGVHGKANENAVRIDMIQGVKNWGGNTLSYIRGEFSRPNPVLDMALNGMKHPGDGHYFPIKAPTASDGEVDWAMWAKQAMGIEKHICWIWNDNTATPFTAAIVAEAVQAYDGCRLGMENVAFGVCLEANENMSVDLVASACGWIHAAAPTSPVIVGSANEDFLKQVGSRVSYSLLWVEQSSNPVMLSRNQPTGPMYLSASGRLKTPLTRDTFTPFMATCKRLATIFGYDRVVPGEWRASTPADVKWMTDQLLAAGFTFLGSGKYN